MMRVKLMALALLGSLLTPLQAQAQISPDYSWLMQGGFAVGAIFVPHRPERACIYLEYWYLTSDYVYPGRDNPVATTIEPSRRGLEAFERFRDENPDGHLVTVRSRDDSGDC